MTGPQRRLAAGLFTVAWGTNVSTPLILRYQDRLGLGDSGAVGIFTVYVVGILGALLFAGRLSDRVGRRPLVLPATALSAVGSLIMLGGRDSLALLLAGRFVLGAVSGATLSVGSAWITELGDRPGGGGAAALGAARLHVATITTITLYLGFGFGPITSALLERFVPAPLVVPYVLHAVACVVASLAMRRLPETKRPDPTVSLRPRLGVPPEARADFARVLAPSAVWVFGFPSVSFALLPVVLRGAIGGADVLVAGATGSLTAVSVLLSRPIVGAIGDARRAIPLALAIGSGGYVVGTVALTTGAWWLAPLAAVLLGTASGTLMASGLAATEDLADEADRGALSATFYLFAYSGMAMPLVITGLGALTSTATALVVVTAAAITATATVALTAGRRDRPVPVEIG